jgi:hypothetical protein
MGHGPLFSFPGRDAGTARTTLVLFLFPDLQDIHQKPSLMGLWALVCAGVWEQGVVEGAFPLFEALMRRAPYDISFTQAMCARQVRAVIVPVVSCVNLGRNGAGQEHTTSVAARRWRRLSAGMETRPCRPAPTSSSCHCCQGGGTF